MTTSQNSPLTFIASLGGELFEFQGVTQATSFTLLESKNLLNGEISSGGLEDLKQELSQVSIESIFTGAKNSTTVFHLFYELGAVLENKVSVQPSSEDTLGIVLKFSEKKPYKPLSEFKKVEVINIWGPARKDYNQAFETGLAHLKRGDCYQYNLTFPFKIGFSKTTFDQFIANCWAQKSSIGSFASVTKLPNSSQVLFSNSPECLFNIQREGESYAIETFPIKGTQSTENCTSDEAWNLLANSSKDQSELFMITDLMRNDLSRLSGQWAEVVSKKERMIVPSLVHSFSHIKTLLEGETTLLDILECLFPGGSITGAPKVRVMEILDSLENVKRGFYCGTTLIASSERLSASINIRSGVLDCEKGEMQYHSGGGITFRSQAGLEFQEMWDKVQSFVGVFAAHQNQSSINSDL